MADPKIRQTLRLTCQPRQGWNYGVVHTLDVAKVINYLKDNPTLDESRPPLSYSPSGWCSAKKYTDYVRGNGWVAGNELKKQDHIVPWDVLKAHIKQHPALNTVYTGAGKTKTITNTVTVEKLVEVYLPLGDDSRAEMIVALQRQQHVRNEYVRRAYVARHLAESTGNEAVYQRELDEQLKGMATLKRLMTELNVPMADWTDNALALAQYELIERKETTDGLHDGLVRGDGGSGLVAETDQPAKARSRTRKAGSQSAVVQ